MLRRTISILLIVTMLLTCMVQGVFAAEQTAVSRYSDVSENYWAANDIIKWTDNGLLQGNPDGSFKPDKNLTRAEFCAIINKIFGYSKESNENFKDIKPTSWYASVASKARAAGYIDSWTGDEFNGNTTITREEVAAAIFHILKLSKADTAEYLSKYSDLKEYKGSFADQIAAVIANSYFAGYSNKTFKPGKGISRAEITKVLSSIFAGFFNTPGTYSGMELKGNVIINTPGVILKDIKITGNIYLAEGIGVGDVTLENVTVTGNAYISGGGKISINGKLVQQGAIGPIIPSSSAPAGNSGSASAGSSGSSSSGGSGSSGNNTPNTPEKVAAPVFSVPEGTYTKTQNVEITCGTAGASIRYTTDGTIPNVNSAVYTSAIKVETTTTLKAVATKSGMTDSAVVSATYTISPPQGEWELVWNDEFDGTALDETKWWAENSGGGFGNSEEQFYRPDNAAVKDGKLVITPKMEDYTKEGDNYKNPYNYTSAKLFSKAAWKYGKFEAKIKLPVGQGFWPAFWMMPNDGAYGKNGGRGQYGNWPGSGEIDIMEAKGRLPGEASGALHYGPPHEFQSKGYTFPEGQTIDQFHTYAVEWEPGEIRWYIDGKLYNTIDNWHNKGEDGEKYSFPAPFDKEFYLMLNLAIGGNFDGGKKPDASMFPAQMEVDYVRVYELTGRPYKTPVEPNINAGPLPDGARQPDATGNLVKDMNFEQGIKDNQEGVDADFGEVWNYIHNAQFGGAANVSVDAIDGKNYARIDVTNKGSQPYSIQLEQHTTLGNGRWYQFSFDAKADRDRTIETKLGGGPTRGWSAYSEGYAPRLTTEMKKFSYKFQMTRDSDVQARIEFNCATDTGSVWIGNVRVEEVAAPVVDYNGAKEPLEMSGNHIYNGAFDKYKIDRMTYWNVTNSSAVAEVKVPEDTRELTAKITNGGADSGAITVDQKGVQLIKERDYKLTFKARADADRTINIKLVSKDGKTAYMEQEINLTTAMQELERTFKMAGETDKESQLVFLLGGNDADVYIDDVSLICTTVEVDPDFNPYPLQNGDFSNSTYSPWQMFFVGGAADLSVENGEAKVTTKVLGSDPWSIMFAQNNLKFSKGVEYVLKFDARSTVARDVGVILEANDGQYSRRFDKVVSLTDKSETFEFSFKAPYKEELNFKFLMGGLKGAAPSDILIDNVVLQAKDVSVKQPPALEPDTTDNRLGNAVELTFADNAEWRGAFTAIKVDGIALTAGQYKLESGRMTINADVFTAAKSYKIVIQADGYANAAVAQDVGGNDGNLVKNGTYANGKENWEIWTGDGGSGAFEVVDGAAKIDISNLGPNNWSIQFNQSGIQVKKGKTYELSFKAKSTKARPVQVEFYQGGEITKFDFTNEMTAYKYTLAVPETDKTVKLNFLIGKVATIDANIGEHTIYIDDVVIKELIPNDGNLVENGNFVNGTEDWGFWTGEGGAGTSSGENGEMKIAVSAVGNASYAVQAFQEGLIFQNGKTYRLMFKAKADAARKININIGKALTASPWFVAYMPMQTCDLTTTMQEFSYDFKMTEASYENGKLVFEAGKVADTDVATNIYIDDVVVKEVEVAPLTPPTLTADSAEKVAGNVDVEITFTDNEAWRNAIKTVKIDSAALAADKYSFVPGKLTIDKSSFAADFPDVKDYAILVEAEGFKQTQVIQKLKSNKVWTEVGQNLLIDGTFDITTTIDSTSPGAIWKVHNQGDYEQWAGEADFVVTGGAIEATVNQVGWDWWQIQLYQDPVNNVQTGTYKIAFDMSSEIERPIYVELAGSGAPRRTFTVGISTQTYEAIVDVTSPGNFKFLFGLGRAGTDPELTIPYKITIDNVKLIKVQQQ